MDDFIDLVERLADAIERREAAEPDLGGWEAEAEVRRLERRLVTEVRLARVLDPRALEPDARVFAGH